jgi:hypothetical protein
MMVTPVGKPEKRPGTARRWIIRAVVTFVAGSIMIQLFDQPTLDSGSQLLAILALGVIIVWTWWATRDPETGEI